MGLPLETKATYYPSGWMQIEIFTPTWIDHFIKYAKPSEERPILLILDGHATHVKNLELTEVQKKNMCIFLVLPPHTSHRLQPLDVSLMFPLSAYYEQTVKSWLSNNSGKVVTAQFKMWVCYLCLLMEELLHLKMLLAVSRKLVSAL